MKNQDNQKIEQLKKIIPEVFTEGGIDWEKFQVFFSKNINFKEERYHLNWAGKEEAYKDFLESFKGTLTPSFEESLNFQDTQNIFIEGDNLKVLKALENSYSGKIKMIYIDPPYNTGNDSFIYFDKFSESLKEYRNQVGDTNEEGYFVQDSGFKKNPKENGHYHSNWLSMMYLRLLVARTLLREDGVIFVSIDDNEVHNLRLLMNEVFGEENFVAQISIVGNPRGRDYGGVAQTHDYILIYQKSDLLELNLIRDKNSKGFILFDDLGGFELRELRNRNIKFNKENRPNLYYPFYINEGNKDSNGLFEISIEFQFGWIELYPLESQGINTVWRWGKLRSQENLNINIKAKAMKNGSYQIVEKYRELKIMAKSFWVDKDVNTEKGTLLVKNLFQGKVFDYPKPVEMIMRMIEMGTSLNTNDIILDFFAGSGTTAQAVMELNAEEASLVGGGGGGTKSSIYPRSAS